MEAPTEEPQQAGLTKQGQPKRASIGAVGLAHGDEIDDGQAFPDPEFLGHLLVHADCRAEDARSHVGEVRALQEALNGAVLAEGAVEHGEDEIAGQGFDAARGRHRDEPRAWRGVDGAPAPYRRQAHHVAFARASWLGLGLGARQLEDRGLLQQPDSRLGYPDKEEAVLGRIEVADDARRRNQGDIVFARLPPLEYRDGLQMHSF